VSVNNNSGLISFGMKMCGSFSLLARLTVLLLLPVGFVVSCGKSNSNSSQPGGQLSARPPADSSSLVHDATAGSTDAQLQLGIRNLGSTNAPPNYSEAVKWLTQAAQSGNAQAEFLLGTLYQTGQGVKRDYTNALVWFEKAAAQKHREALYNLGSLYASGRGVLHDSEKAAHYYQQAAELGDSYAQFNVAQRWELGRGVATNFVEAWKWYDLAAQGGVEDAVRSKRALEMRMTPAQVSESRQAVADFLKGTPAKN
jgi:TPR repeat protein